MSEPVEPDAPEDALRISRPRAWAVRAKSYSPRLAELPAPARYARNLRLVNRLKDEGLSMITNRRGRTLVELARRADRRGVPGAIVDCGVWNGGSTVLMGIGSPDREVWAFDSFEGLPKPGPRDPDAHADWEGEVRGSEQALIEGFGRHAPNPERLHVVKGWFDETLPASVEGIGEIAILHVDADWYDSVSLVLECFYDRVAPGGAVVVDDYTTWRGAKDATDEFRAARGVEPAMVGRHYWLKA